MVYFELTITTYWFFFNSSTFCREITLLVQSSIAMKAFHNWAPEQKAKHHCISAVVLFCWRSNCLKRQWSMSESVFFMSTQCTVHIPNSSSISHRRVGWQSWCSCAHQKTYTFSETACHILFARVRYNIFSLWRLWKCLCKSSVWNGRRSVNVWECYLEYIVSWLNISDVNPLAINICIVCVVAAWTQTLGNYTLPLIKQQSPAWY